VASLKLQEDGSSLLEEPFFYTKDPGTGGCLALLYGNICISVYKSNESCQVFHTHDPVRRYRSSPRTRPQIVVSVVQGPPTIGVTRTIQLNRPILPSKQGGLMNQPILIGSLVVILAALVVLKLKRTPKRQKRWMPDIRRVV
jgi:hypothetical protein